MEETTRKIVAILFSDIAGYTAAMGQDEEAAIRAVSRSRTVQKELVRKFHGDWVQEVGDGALCTFASAVEAVSCALEIQRAFQGDPDFQLRIGIHVGDIVFRKTATGYDVFGDGVNVASRVQGVSDAGGICVSERVYDDLRNRKGIEVRFLGEKQLKNVNRPIGVYAILDREGLGAATATELAAETAPRRWWIGGGAALALAGLAALAWWALARPQAPPAPSAPEPVLAAPPAETPPAPQAVVPRAAPPQAQPLAAAVAPAPPPALAFEALRRALLARVGPWGEARARVATDPNPVPNEERYQIVFEARCDCEAMLFSIDGNKDEISLLYPNPYDPQRRLEPGEKRRLPGTGVYSFRAVGGEGVDMLKLFVTSGEFSFPAANINAWAATPSEPERMAELAGWLDSLEKISFATAVTPLQIRR